jgi:methionyl-tRNA formyltransferase
MNHPLRIVFLGSDAIALPLLEWMVGAGAELVRVVAVFTQPDRAVGRGQKVQANAIKTWALAQSLPVLQPEKLTPEVRQGLADFGADLALVMAYGHILRDDFIATPRLGTLNLHTSILPRLRGASPIQTAVALGERETGVTLMRIVRRLDAGPVAAVERVAIDPLATAADVESRLAESCVPLLARTLPLMAAGTLTFQAQDDAAATYCRKLTKEDGVLDFGARSEVLAARVNGLFPWPCCAAEIAGQVIKFGQADSVAIPVGVGADERHVGRILGTDGQGLLIATGHGALRVRRLQRPGGRMLAAGEFLRGFPVPAGTLLASQPMPSLVAAR